MVDGVQPKSFAQAAAATLKLVRSAQSRTLPAKNTVTVIGQLIGAAGRWALTAMAFLPCLVLSPGAGSFSEHDTDNGLSPCATASCSPWRPGLGNAKSGDGWAEAGLVRISLAANPGYSCRYRRPTWKTGYDRSVRKPC